MTDDEPGYRSIDVPYIPFVDGDEDKFARLPDYIRGAIDAATVWAVPDQVDFDDPVSILRLYIFDIEWAILPETHADNDGYTFTNVSYYTTHDAEIAQSRDLGGISRTTVSAGFVRQIAGIAHSIWPLVTNSVVQGPAMPMVIDLDPVSVLTGARAITEDEFSAIIQRYPRLFGWKPDRPKDEPTDIEYLLFADMLRFAWAHEWIHGLFGHVSAFTALLGEDTLNEGHAPGTENDVLLRRAFEFQADAVALGMLLDSIARGEDPGRLVEFRDGYARRIVMLALAIAFMATHWSAIERTRSDGQRVHPDAALRLLQVWLIVVDHLQQVGRTDETPVLNGLAGSALFALADALPPFAALRGVIPGVVRTPQMEHYRTEMLDYIDRLEQQAHLLNRFDLDESARGAIPHVVPN